MTQSPKNQSGVSPLFHFYYLSKSSNPLITLLESSQFQTKNILEGPQMIAGGCFLAF